ncbi:nucleoside triphosphate pyrophosphohydrolase family protein [Microcystis sp. M42BS1]|uniref:nucleoside triphosphate pyrophosphohydrolase family protein n=1 Tax=Microcystis sp. M42BS1 TaxID=2771192 RepID=UPI00258C612F|nr:nucleoside triphosphate pyrophosphohydrolase family protein [Microcystis sp. M42BS1]MCA2570655.1 nucleoside triphosphate pyrophosphohydrolase family protein [Microcystis sp. M42BS1]
MLNYQEEVKKYRLPTYTPEACVMGLLSEAGEVAGVFQKLIRGDYTPDVAMSKLYKELGDVLWHVAGVATDNGWTLEEIMKDNIDKLESRRIRSVIVGSGDDR